MTCPKSENQQFELTKAGKMTIKFELFKVIKITCLKISNHGEAKNKFGQQVNLIQRAPLGTLPQVVVMSLPHNHITLTNLFSLVTEGLLLSNLHSKNNSLIELGHFSIGGSHYLFIM